MSDTSGMTRTSGASVTEPVVQAGQTTLSVSGPPVPGRSRGGGRRRRRRGGPFQVVNGILLSLVGLLCVYPFVYILAVSLSDGSSVASGEVVLWPVELNVETYRYLLADTQLGVLRSLGNSLLYTAVGVLFSVTITYLTAYPLSKSRLFGGPVLLLLFVITWIFDAGIIPTYIINEKLGFVDNWLVMVIPWGFSTFLLIITITFLRSIPVELEESAFVDGANDLQIMSRIYLPLSKPLLATIGIFYAVQVWNSFLVPLIYLQDRALAPIQLVLYRLLIAGDTDSAAFSQITSNGVTIAPQNLQAATMVFAMVPILCFYPYAQRYFSKGLLVGSVKG